MSDLYEAMSVLDDHSIPLCRSGVAQIVSVGPLSLSAYIICRDGSVAR